MVYSLIFFRKDHGLHFVPRTNNSLPGVRSIVFQKTGLIHDVDFIRSLEHRTDRCQLNRGAEDVNLFGGRI